MMYASKEIKRVTAGQRRERPLTKRYKEELSYKLDLKNK